MIISLTDITELHKYVNSDEDDSLFIFDVDNTILGVDSSILHKANYNFLEVYFKKLESLLDEREYEILLSIIMLQRKPRLVDEELLVIISRLRKKGTKTIALTKFPTSSFGKIKNRARWRFDELISLGIDFSFSFPEIPKLVYFPDEKSDSQENIATYNSGILMTGELEKEVALDKFLKKANFTPKKVIMVDDSIGYLQSVSRYCDENKIDFMGFHYFPEYLKNVPEVDGKVVKLQFDYLVQNKSWLDQINLDDNSVESTADKSLVSATLFSSQKSSFLLKLLADVKKRIPREGQVQLVYQTKTEAEDCQRQLQAIMEPHSASAAARPQREFLIEEIRSIDEDKSGESAASTAAAVQDSYAITLCKDDYNQVLQDTDAYDELLQSFLVTDHYHLQDIKKP